VCPRDATPLEDAPHDEDPAIGLVLAESYEIIRVIGEGGMGRVYEARHKRLHKKHYAVKMLHHELARQPEVVTRFQREAEAASALDHPNVVGVFDVNVTSDGRPYIVAELLEGTELGDYLEAAGRISASDAAEIVMSVCRALGAAHARGIVHRDMKPENVFIVGEPPIRVVKVLDFGISKVDGQGGATLTKTGMVMGTPGYIAPEQARGDKVDFHADIYAVGAMLYRAVTGKKPFDDLDPMAAITAVLVDEPPRPRSIEASIPPAFEMVIQKAMAIDPRERYASMAEFEAALSQFVTESPEQIGDLTITSATDRVGVTAPTLLALRDREKSPATDTLMAVTRNVKLARPTIFLFTMIGFLWLSAGLVDAIGGAVRLLGSDKNEITSTVVNLIVIIGAIIAAVGLAAWLMYVKRKIWGNTPRAVVVALRLRRTVVYSAAAYGAATLAVRLLQTLVYRQAQAIAWPGWDVVLFVLALLVGAVAWVTTALTPR
jgi:serine/threonine-protein kinase